MEPGVSVFLPSYNKREWVLDAMRSVFMQTRTDWELWILENSNDDGATREIVERELASQSPEIQAKVRYEKIGGPEFEQKRREKYITCWLLNAYYPEASREHIFFLADDDIIDPDCFAYLAGELDEHPSWHVVYASLRLAMPTAPGDCGPWPDAGGIPASNVKAFPGSVDCHVDSGQIMHRKTCLDALSFPYFEESPDGSTARHSDGIFMERLVAHFPFQPVPKYLISHRYTNLSTWTPR